MLKPFLLEEAYNLHEHANLINISSATFPALSLDDLLAPYTVEQRKALLERLTGLALDYGEARASWILREKIATKLYQDCGIGAQHLLCSSGASEAIFILFSLLAKPGAVFVVQKPIYQSLYSIAKDRGATVIDWVCKPEQTSEQNISSLARILETQEKITALVLCNPSNPLGIQFRDEELASIAALLSSHSDSALLIVDEVFRPSSMIPSSSALKFYEHTVVIADMSKAFGLAGLRLGWLATRSELLLDSALALKNYLSLRLNPFDEAIASLALDQTELITQRHRELAQQNLRYLQRFIAVHNIGAPMVYLEFLAEPPVDLFVVRGDLFEDDPSRFRLGLGLEHEDFKQILNKILPSVKMN